MLWEFIELPPFAASCDGPPKGKGERDDVPRAWLKRIKEVFNREQA